MPWERGYYYRKKRIGARVVSEYIGGGLSGTFAAADDLEAQEQRAQAQASTQAARLKGETLDQSIAAADELISAAMFEALEAAGYHRHARGQWRKRRDAKNKQSD